MLDTGARSGWIFKRIQSKTKWAVEIARQKQFGIRPIYSFKRPREPPDHDSIHLHARVVPERKAATRAKKLLKERSLREKLVCDLIVEKKCSKTKRGTKKTPKQTTHSDNIIVEHPDDHGAKTVSLDKTPNEVTRKRGRKAKRKNVRLNRKDKALIRKFAIGPCMVCVPKLSGGQSVQNEENETDLNMLKKRITNIPEKVIVLGDSNIDPIIVSDDDSDVEFIAVDINLEGTSRSPIILNDDGEVENDYNNNIDPNDADVEESSDDDTIDSDDDVDSLDENADILSNDDGDYDNDNVDNDDDDFHFFSKFRNNLKTYDRSKRKCLIAPATFQPKRITVAPARFSVPSSFRTSPFLTF